MKTKKESDEVLFADEEVRVFGPDDVEALGRRALDAPSGKIRVCLHRSPDDKMHEMLVALRKDVRYPPHSHKYSEETFLVLKGCATLHLFDAGGEPLPVIHLGDPFSGRCGYARLPAGMWHCLRQESDVVVFLETKLGPFRPEDTCVAPFRIG